ncbi:DUF4223 family protein [Salmonella enterica subsp. enterica serovar Weltevreden]|nr:DUF4223 family protein [Salmonella enterica subsp. enterica serovar Weltevreden]
MLNSKNVVVAGVLATLTACTGHTETKITYIAAPCKISISKIIGGCVPSCRSITQKRLRR